MDFIETDERPKAATVGGKAASVARAIDDVKKKEDENEREEQKLREQAMMPLKDTEKK